MNIYLVEEYLKAISKYNPNDIYLGHEIKEYKKQLLSQKFFLKSSYNRKKKFYIDKNMKISKFCDDFFKNFVNKLNNQQNKEFLQKCIK